MCIRDSFQEVYPNDEIEWKANDLGFFGLEGLDLVNKVSKEIKISPELIKKIIDIEVESSGLGSRRGISNKIESMLKKDWDSIENVFESKKITTDATNEFKSKRDNFKELLNQYNQ